MLLRPENFTYLEAHAEFTVGGRTYLVDHDDVEIICGRTWYPCGVGSQVYLGTKMPGQKNVSLHTYLVGQPVDRSLSVDHINRNKNDNRRSNLRFANRSEQARNCFRKSRSKYRGVTECHGSYRASISRDGKQTHLGTYVTPEDAAIAHDAALYEITQDISLLNLPDRLGESPKQTRELSDEALLAVLDHNATRSEIAAKYGLDPQTISKLRQGWRPKYYRGAL